jgi:hypothetical protein
MNKICRIEFQFCESLKSISPSPSIKIIRGFNHCHRHSEVVLSSGSYLDEIDEIDGFMECKSLSWIEIIKSKLFQNCTNLIELIFSADSHMREIHGFAICKSLGQIEILASIEMIHMSGSVNLDR